MKYGNEDLYGFSLPNLQTTRTREKFKDNFVSETGVVSWRMECEWKRKSMDTVVPEKYSYVFP